MAVRIAWRSSNLLEENIGSVTDVYSPEEPRYKVRWVLALPRIDPPIARACMAAPVPWPVRLARQVSPRAHIRDCCWHHSIDWRKASAVAIRLARRLNREHIADEDDGDIRYFALIRALGLPERQEEAVEALLNPYDGTSLDRLAGDRWRRSYMNGRKRTHAMLEAGVRRTVIVRWQAPRRHWGIPRRIG